MIFTFTVRSVSLRMGALLFALAIPLAGASEAYGQAPTTARVFTINELLARHDTGRPQAAGRVAAVERENTASDAAPRAMRGLGVEPFGLHAFPAPDGLLWNKWRGLEADLAREAAKIEACQTDAKQCSPEARRYLLIVGEAKSREGRARLETANRLMNGAIRYVSDEQQHGAADRWTAPLATLAAEQGDCEDYTIAKFAALRDAGVPETDMRLVLVRDTAARLDHAILAVRHEGEWLVLDNRRSFVAATDELKHYMPLFAIDREGVKLFAAPYASWGEGAPEFADWSLRGTDGARAAIDPAILNWSLRGTDAEPAAAEGARDAR